MQTARDLTEPGEGDRGQKASCISSHTNGPHRLRNMGQKMNSMMFLLFINSDRSGDRGEGKGRQPCVIIDYNAENIMGRYEFSPFIWWPRLSHGYVCLSRCLCLQKGHICCICAVVSSRRVKEKIPLPHVLDNHTPRNSFVLVWLCLGGDTQVRAPFVAQN